MINTWAPLWSAIVDSSLWEEEGDVVKVFMTILATKDSEHVCPLDAYRIANRCNFRLPCGGVDEDKVVKILKLLASPDKRRSVPQKEEGRRIRAVEGGWFVINGEKYRKMVQLEMQRARNRRSQAASRERAKQKKHCQQTPTDGPPDVDPDTDYSECASYTGKVLP